ncbi:hypothetical protein DXG01_012481 [Tephrocybe rancida]|nr:hypothetical protein DXG01_012481 [Tephrocybe rancida]
MARPTTRAAKRKRTDDDDDADDNNFNDDDDDNHKPLKLQRHESIPLTLHDDHAKAILDILDMIDTQGLLDRVFPVSDHPERSESLRTLLGDKQKQSLGVLKAAIMHLQPISSLPRAKPSPTATQQHRFCTLALDLLNQASSHNHPIPSLDAFLPPSSPYTPQKPIKYALVQHLPTHDFWTSLASQSTLSSALTHLPTAHAELVAVLPTPAPTSEPYPAPTLAAYAPALDTPAKPRPQQRTVCTGAFLDFGPWASFAPTFDHDAEVVGREELGLVLYARHERQVRRLNAQREAWEGWGSIEEVVPMDEDEKVEEKVDLERELNELLPPDEAAAVKAALDTLELQRAVHELLDRNRSALVRLEQLQNARLFKDGTIAAEEGSEEWDTGETFPSFKNHAYIDLCTAQGILETLTVLASLRPRTSTPTPKSTSKNPSSILPPPTVLHKLHRTLGTTPTPGWHGTLPSSRPQALSDSTTFKKSSRAPAPPPAPAPTPTPAPPAAAPAPVAPVPIPYTGYTYAYGQQGATPYRPAGTPTGGAGTNGTQQAYAQYAPQYYAYAPQAQGGAGQVQGYYGQQQQGYAAAGAYTWYSAYNQQQQGGAGAGGSGTSTPTPGQQQATYGSFFGGRTPAVANTVYAPVQGTATALPAHLRAQVGQGGQAAGQGGQQQQYYAYQPPVQQQVAK